MTDAGWKMWAHKETKDPTLGAILLARRVNHLCGGAVVAPWDVYELPEEWLTALEGMEEWLK